MVDLNKVSQTEWNAAMQIIDNAAGRVDYRLTYEATPTPRECHGNGISGPPIQNAYNPSDPKDRGSGDWEDPDFVDSMKELSEEAAIDRWFVVAVREAVHEALEWYRVDGQIFLDPHGEHEISIHDVSEKFAIELLKIRESE